MQTPIYVRHLVYTNKPLLPSLTTKILKFTVVVMGLPDPFRGMGKEITVFPRNTT